MTSVERFRLRVLILQRGFTTVRRVVFQSTRRAHEKPHAMGPELAQLEAARSDIHTLSKESLESLRMFLEGLAAEKR